MITGATLSFLSNLKANNDRDWFQEHKAEYQAAYTDFFDTVLQLLGHLSAFDSGIAGSHLDPKACIMRINRDIRFSKDKSPYKSNFFAFFSKGGRKSPFAGYYLHLEPGKTFAGGGIYMPEPDILERIRREIDLHFEELQAVVGRNAFVAQFPEGILASGRTKRPPKGYDVSNPAIGYLTYKGYYTQRFFSDREVTGTDFPERLADTCRAAKPLVDFLNRPLQSSL
jgi:uncharacterized protein (TIGR02453 family)